MITQNNKSVIWYTSYNMKIFKKILKWCTYAVIGIIALITILITTIDLMYKPSNDKDWNPDQSILPKAEIDGNLVTIRNVRNFSYASTKDFTPSYYDKTYDTDRLKKVWFVVEPFSGYKGAAHTFLSFEFEDDAFVSISVEIRKERGESFDAFKGLLNQYELMYVAADERDVVNLRSNYRHDQVYVYPIKADQQKAKLVFMDMITRMNKLAADPEFYNTLTSTCTTNIVSHVNKISPERVPFSLKVLFPANSDQLAYDIGLIDTDLPFTEARAKYLINDRAIKYADDPMFSVRIRE